MMRSRISTTMASSFVGEAVFAAAPTASGGVQVDLYEDFDAWQAAANNNTTTIDFTGHPSGTPVSDQYHDLGITFHAPFPHVSHLPTEFLNDEWGISEIMTTPVRFTFDTPRRALAAHLVGGLRVFLYHDGNYVWHSSTVWLNSGVGIFEGLISSAPFDEVVFTDNSILVDDLHFGLPVPAPAALPLLALGLGTARRRWRGGE